MQNYGVFPSGLSSIPSTSAYTKSFQQLLLAHIYHSEELMKLALKGLQVSDFDLPTCKLMWEALRKFYVTYGRMPEFNVFMVHCLAAIENRDSQYQVSITPEEHESFSALFDYITMYDTAALNIEYIKAELQPFITFVRVNQQIDQFTTVRAYGADPRDHVAKMAATVKKTQELFDDGDDIEFITETPDLLLDEKESARISTGIPKLDTFLDGGIAPGEIGMITANPGVGKTNLLLQMSLSASLKGYDCLFFSLELPGYKIKRRYLAMLAGVQGATIKTVPELWAEQEKRQMAAILQPSFEAYNKCAIIDRSKARLTADDIEEKIAQWKQKVKERDGTDENCKIICVDWLEYIMAPRSFTRRDPNDWERYIAVLQEFGFAAKRQGVGIWTANQGNKESDGKTVIRMKDTARGYHSNDALDIALGAALHPDYRVSEEDLDAGVAKRDDRKLLVTINKNREGSLGITEIYQCPTLRFFDSEREYHAYKRALASMTDADSQLYDVVKLNNTISKVFGNEMFAGLEGAG